MASLRSSSTSVRLLRLSLQNPQAHVRQLPHRSYSAISNTSEATSQLSSKPEKWDLYASVCLERKPVITQELKPLEKKYLEFLTEYEMENSKKADHEIRHEKDQDLIEKIKTGEIDQGNIETAQDLEDSSVAEFLKFVPMGRITDADKENDTKSLHRALDSHLLLVVEQKLGKDYKWICPQLVVKPGETLRQAAERILAATCPGVKAKVMGNAPWGFYKYKYPKGTKSESGEVVSGAKVFFYKANHLSGNLDSLKIKESEKNEEIQVKDFVWLTRKELESKLTEKYHKKISQFLVPEG